MGGNSGGGGKPGRGGGGGGDAGQPGEVVREANKANAKPLLNDASFDAKAVTNAIKEGTLSRSDLSMHIDHTKYGIDQAVKAIDTKLANRGTTKASEVRKQPEFQKVVAYRDRLKGQVRDMFDVMKATSNVKQFK